MASGLFLLAIRGKEHADGEEKKEYTGRSVRELLGGFCELQGASRRSFMENLPRLAWRCKFSSDVSVENNHSAVRLFRPREDVLRVHVAEILRRRGRTTGRGGVHVGLGLRRRGGQLTGGVRPALLTAHAVLGPL